MDSEKRPPAIVYHAGCADGWCAAWIARRALLARDGVEPGLVPAAYGQLGLDEAVAIVEGREAYVLDFSFPRPTLLAMREHAASLQVLDHHKTAAADLAGLGFCLFDMDRSGARLALDTFMDGRLDRSIDWVVDYVEDRDLWLWRLPESKEVNACLASHPYTPAAWDALADAGPRRAADEGRGILRYQGQLVDRICGNAREVELAGHRVLAACSPLLQSEAGERLAQGRAFGAVWCVDDRGRTRVSLRSRPPEGVDVSAIAKGFGGGGHAQAAGFELDAPIPIDFTVLGKPT